MEEWQRLLAQGVNSVAQLREEHPEIDPNTATQIARTFSTTSRSSSSFSISGSPPERMTSRTSGCAAM